MGRRVEYQGATDKQEERYCMRDIVFGVVADIHIIIQQHIIRIISR